MSKPRGQRVSRRAMLRLQTPGRQKPYWGSYLSGDCTMSLSKYLLIAIAGLSLSACAATTTKTAAQQRYDSMASVLDSLGTQSVSCLNAVTVAHPEADKIFSLDNKSRIKKTDKKTESARLSEFMQCREREYEQTKSNPDYYVRSFAPILKESIDLRADVYKKYMDGEITGSEGYSSLKNISDYLGSKWDAHNQEIVDNLNQQHFQQLQAQAATQALMFQTIGAGFQDYNRQQQQFNQQRQANQINMPVRTQCRWDGGVMNCTSW